MAIRWWFAAVALVCCTLTARAENYPSRPIRMLIPQPPGGTMETIARGVAYQMTPLLGQNIVIDNRAGANGIIAGELLARALPDGYTLLYTSASLANNHLAHKKLSFDPLRDFAPVTQLTVLPGYLVLTNPQVPAQTMRDLVELSKSQPGKVRYGSSGYGNSQHLLGELINARAGARFEHVPYKGFALITTALLSNEVQISFGAPTTVMPYVRAGRLRTLAYSGAKRWSGLPDLPTLQEAGVPVTYEASWHGLFAPLRTPVPVITRLRDAVVQAMRAPQVKDLLDQGGHVTIASTPAEFSAYLQTYFRDTAEQMRIAGVQPQ